MRLSTVGKLVVPFCFCAVFFAWSTPAAASSIISGQITDWVESGPKIQVGDGTNKVTMWWSINTFDKGWFYGHGTAGCQVGACSDVAYAFGISDISQIVDASIFTFTSNHVGPFCDADCDPNGVGAFLVFRNITSGYYGVLRVDDIVGFNQGTLDGTWWFQTNGSADFSSSTVPEPSSLALFVSGVAGVIARRRRKKSNV